MKYGVFKKGDWKCLVAFETKEEAEKLIGNRQDLDKIIKDYIEEIKEN